MKILSVGHDADAIRQQDCLGDIVGNETLLGVSLSDVFIARVNEVRE